MDAPRLRLVTDGPAIDSSGGALATEAEARTFKFPGSVRDVVGRRDPRMLTSDEVARMAMRSLESAQSQLDALRHASGAFPGARAPGGDGPRAA